MTIVFLLLALIVAIGAIIFALANPGIITVSLLAWKFDTSLAVVVIIAFALGVLVTVLVLLPGLIKSRYRLSVHKKTIKDLQKTLPKPEPEE